MDCTSKNSKCIKFYPLVRVKFWCQMDFFGYPFDVQVVKFTCHCFGLSNYIKTNKCMFFQVCNFYLGSTWHHSEAMTFNLKDLKMYSASAQIDTTDYFLHYTDTNIQYKYEWGRLAGNFTSGLENHIQFSVVGFKLMLERYYFKYIWSYYIPSLIFIVISWISFVIPPEAIPGRMAMLITLLLLFINLFGQIIRNQPASRITLLSIWTLACTMFVTAALFAYGMLLWTKWRRPSDNKTIKVQTGSPLHPEDQNGSQTRETKDHVNGFTLGLIDKLIGTSNNWDRNCLILFPLVFLVFNLIYWPFVFAQHLAVEDSFNAT